jgi:hypothetical protein
VKGALIGIVLAVAGAAVLYWTTLSHASVTCEVCIRYGGHERCASASAPSEAEAVQAATMTACGVLAGGVTGAISCQATPPYARSCTP